MFWPMFGHFFTPSRCGLTITMPSLPIFSPPVSVKHLHGIRSGTCCEKQTLKEQKEMSLVLLDGRLKDLPVAAVDTEKTIFYTSTSGRSEGVTIGPGSLFIRLKAQKIPGHRGVYDLSVQPIFSPLGKSRIPRPVKGDEAVPFEFDALGFRLKAGPGDFFFLGPKKYTTDQTGLAAILFSREIPRPVVRLYMFLCGGMTD